MLKLTGDYVESTENKSGGGPACTEPEAPANVPSRGEVAVDDGGEYHVVEEILDSRYCVKGADSFILFFG